MGHSIQIKAKTVDDYLWRPKLDEITMPTKAFFIIDGFSQNLDIIKKTIWDFGDATKLQTMTNRKLHLETAEISHIFRPKNIEHESTLSISVSVFTADDLFIPKAFKIEKALHKKSHMYIDPEQFKDQIVEYYNVGGDLTDVLADSVYQIATRLAYAPNFINYTYREEMIGDALIKMIEALQAHKFDPLKGNPFSYFTKIAYHAFCNRIKKEKKMRLALTSYQEEVYETLIAEGVLPATKGTMHHDDD